MERGVENGLILEKLIRNEQCHRNKGGHAPATSVFVAGSLVYL